MTANVTLAEYERVQQICARRGMSPAALLREALELLERDLSNLAPVPEPVTYPCWICGEPVELRPGEADAERVVRLLVEERWSHDECMAP